MRELNTALKTVEREYATEDVLPRQRQNAVRDAVLDELSELASLAAWVRRSVPPLIHRAVLAGAEPRSIAAAAGLGVAEAHIRWHNWADTQLHDGEQVALAQYLAVHDALARCID